MKCGNTAVIGFLSAALWGAAAVAAPNQHWQPPPQSAQCAYHGDDCGTDVPNCQGSKPPCPKPPCRKPPLKPPCPAPPQRPPGAPPCSGDTSGTPVNIFGTNPPLGSPPPCTHPVAGSAPQKPCSGCDEFFGNFSLFGPADYID